MSNRLMYSAIFAVAIGSAVLGYGVAGLDDQTQTDHAVASALAAVTPAPTPAPTPIPTPLIVSIAPPECAQAINTLFTQSLPDIQFIIDTYSAYLDHPGQSMSAFGLRVKTLLLALAAPPTQSEIDELQRQAEVCRAAK